MMEDGSGDETDQQRRSVCEHTILLICVFTLWSDVSGVTSAERLTFIHYDGEVSIR